MKSPDGDEYQTMVRYFASAIVSSGRVNALMAPHHGSDDGRCGNARSKTGNRANPGTDDRPNALGANRYQLNALRSCLWPTPGKI